MAKRSKRQKGIVQVTKGETRPYTTTTGRTIMLSGMPPLAVQRIANSVDFPSVPTYTVELASGDTETHDHDETTLDTPEDHAAWEKYIEEQDAADDKQTEMLLKAILVKGVEVKISDEELEEWLEELEVIGLELPKNKKDQQLAYLETEIIATTYDAQQIMEIVMELTGVSEEDIEDARDSFRDTMESAEETDNGEASTDPEDTEGELAI